MVVLYNLLPNSPSPLLLPRGSSLCLSVLCSSILQPLDGAARLPLATKTLSARTPAVASPRRLGGRCSPHLRPRRFGVGRRSRSMLRSPRLPLFVTPKLPDLKMLLCRTWTPAVQRSQANNRAAVPAAWHCYRHHSSSPRSVAAGMQRWLPFLLCRALGANGEGAPARRWLSSSSSRPFDGTQEQVTKPPCARPSNSPLRHRARLLTISRSGMGNIYV
jgi:hypothetical protein